MITRLFKDKSFRLSGILTFLFFTTGFILLHYGLINYGVAFFVLLPIVLGISIGALPNKKWALYGSIISLVIFLLLLLAGQLEGFICVIMTLPIIIPLLFIGAIMTHLFKKYNEIKGTDKLKILLIPFLPFLFGGVVEKQVTKNTKKIIEVQSEIVLPYSAMEVYNAIKSVDTLFAEKPFLMKIDLPVPLKCVVDKEEVGGIRTCYFEGGKIVEKITELEKGKILKMDVIDYQLTGRKWLGFVEAVYMFDSLDLHKSKLTRITTYTSELRPRIYWEPLERLGIKQEHEYVFNNLLRDLKKSKTGNKNH
ncbi:MAG TPA: polyketide cyclase [Segetibacter sp.]|jgi:hypothetical protein